MGRRRAWLSFRGDSGQSAVEMAFILPIFVLLVFGALEIGRVLHASIVVTQASREGARVAAVQCTLDPGCATLVQNRIDNSLGGLDAALARTTLDAGPYMSGEPVMVRVEYDVELVTPLIGSLFPGGPITVKGETTMRLE